MNSGSLSSSSASSKSTLLKGLSRKQHSSKNSKKSKLVNNNNKGQSLSTLDVSMSNNNNNNDLNSSTKNKLDNHQNNKLNSSYDIRSNESSTENLLYQTNDTTSCISSYIATSNSNYNMKPLSIVENDIDNEALIDKNKTDDDDDDNDSDDQYISDDDDSQFFKSIPLKKNDFKRPNDPFLQDLNACLQKRQEESHRQVKRSFQKPIPIIDTTFIPNDFKKSTDTLISLNHIDTQSEDIKCESNRNSNFRGLSLNLCRIPTVNTQQKIQIDNEANNFLVDKIELEPPKNIKNEFKLNRFSSAAKILNLDLKSPEVIKTNNIENNQKEDELEDDYEFEIEDIKINENLPKDPVIDSSNLLNLKVNEPIHLNEFKVFRLEKLGPKLEILPDLSIIQKNEKKLETVDNNHKQNKDSDSNSTKIFTTTSTNTENVNKISVSTNTELETTKSTMTSTGMYDNLEQTETKNTQNLDLVDFKSRLKDNNLKSFLSMIDKQIIFDPDSPPSGFQIKEGNLIKFLLQMMPVKNDRSERNHIINKIDMKYFYNDNILLNDWESQLIEKFCNYNNSNKKVRRINSL
jgi:hypothetical protein